MFEKPVPVRVNLLPPLEPDLGWISVIERATVTVTELEFVA